MNVATDQLKAYLETFHSTIESTAKQFLPADCVNSLLHLSFLPAGIRGYVSTQFGVAWEYLPKPSSGIDVMFGSRRIEDFVLERPTRFAKHFERRGPAINATKNITLIKVVVTNEPVPLRLEGPDAHVRIIDSHFDALG